MKKSFSVPFIFYKNGRIFHGKPSEGLFGNFEKIFVYVCTHSCIKLRKK